VLIWTGDGVCIFFKFCNTHLIVVVAVSVLEPLRFGTAVDAWGRSGNIPGNGNMRMDRVIGRPHSARNMPTWLQHLALLFHRSISFYFTSAKQSNTGHPKTTVDWWLGGYAYGFVIGCAYILNTHIHTYVRANIQTGKNTHIRTYMHIQIHTYTYIYTQTHIHTYTYIYILVHTQTYIYIYLQT
jgi:hypothetical protein